MGLSNTHIFFFLKIECKGWGGTKRRKESPAATGAMVNFGNMCGAQQAGRWSDRSRHVTFPCILAPRAVRADGEKAVLPPKTTSKAGAEDGPPRKDGSL